MMRLRDIMMKQVTAIVRDLDGVLISNPGSHVVGLYLDTQSLAKSNPIACLLQQSDWTLIYDYRPPFVATAEGTKKIRTDTVFYSDPDYFKKIKEFVQSIKNGSPNE